MKSWEPLDWVEFLLGLATAAAIVLYFLAILAEALR